MEVLCDCGCGKSGHTSRMALVTAERRQLTETELRTSPVRRWRVLPACEEAFKRELNALSLLRKLAELFERKPWWVRFDNCHLVFRAHYLWRRRLDGFKKAAVAAAKVAIVFSAPEWLAKRLTVRWKPKPRPSGQAVTPTVVHAPLRDSF